jgi:hypothetical protein
MNNKVIFCVCDDSCRDKAKVMLDSFNKHNEGFDSLRHKVGRFKEFRAYACRTAEG